MAKNKTILILGGSYFQVPVINYAKSAGYYVITCDYLPENPGHSYADEYYNVSTTDIDAVLQLATSSKIDGILAYASDPAATTAAYVGNTLGLPSNPYECILTLANKELYRSFLRKHGFNSPHASCFSHIDDLTRIMHSFSYPVMVKPIDSSGSKGVTKVSDVEGMRNAFEYAISFSRAKKIIVEEYIHKQGPQIGGEAFVIDGKIALLCLGDQLVDTTINPYVPTGMLFPSLIPESLYDTIRIQLQGLISQVGFRFGGLNLEIIQDIDNRLYIMEVGPRTGGNFLPELVSYYSRFNIAQFSVETALGHIPAFPARNKSKENRKNKYYAYYAIHSSRKGKLRSIQIGESLKHNLLEQHLFKRSGDPVDIYNGSHCTLGILLLVFNSRQEMHTTVNLLEQLITVEIDQE